MNLKTLILFFFTLPVIGQEFSLNVSSDTILAGNMVTITFVASNIAGQFEGPNMQGLNVVSGPNTSTSMSMINGDVTQKATYSYIVLCESIGEITILPAYLNTREETFETDPFQILVLPNPDGIIEQTPSDSGYFEFNFPGASKKRAKPTESKKKKRTLKKL